MDPRLEMFSELLATQRPGRLLDLGTGHGKFALLATNMGWKVTAVDARTERMPEHQAIEWVRSDVRSFTFDPAEFDCIAILGLLYHLELDAQLALLGRCSGTTAIIDTHVALRAEHSERGFEGRVFEEETEAPTAAWGNERSFWPTEESLVRMLREAGYTSLKLVPPYRPDRTFWLCLPARNREAA